jgi:hypothetical protein
MVRLWGLRYRPAEILIRERTGMPRIIVCGLALGVGVADPLAAQGNQRAATATSIAVWVAEVHQGKTARIEPLD